MKNLSKLNVFSHGQLQDFLTLSSIMDKHNLTREDIQEAVQQKISGELPTEPEKLPIEKISVSNNKLFAHQVLIGPRSKKIESLQDRYELYRKITDYEGSLKDFRKLRKDKRCEEFNRNTFDERRP